MTKKEFSSISGYRFWGFAFAIVGLVLLIRGATQDISVASPTTVFSIDRVVNSSLMFSALSSEIVGGFLLVTGSIFICVASIIHAMTPTETSKAN